MNQNLKLAAAIAAVLSSSAGLAQNAISPASAAAPHTAYYIAGSSAAKNAIIDVVESSVCGSVYSVFSSTPDPNFFAVSCAAPANSLLPNANGTNIFTIWYRAEGGSVTGALPVITGVSLNQLNLNSSATVANPSGGFTVTIGGNATGNGLDDSFSNVNEAPVMLGITDVEPGQLIHDNYPSAYSTTVYGKATSAQLQGLKHTAIFDQVFGIFINPTAAGFSTAEKASIGQAAPAASLSLSTQQIGDLLQGKTTDWSKAVDINGNPVASTSSPVTIINRETGSGSRTATEIFFTSFPCTTLSSVAPIQEQVGLVPGATDYFSTSDVLTAANGTPGSITYATIDQAGGSFPNLTLVAINGVAPSNLNAASGAYGDWFEADFISPATAVANAETGDQKGLQTVLTTAFQKIQGNGFGQADLLGNPNVDTAFPAAIPATSTANVPAVSSKTIYTNPFTRGGASCQVPFLDL